MTKDDEHNRQSGGENNAKASTCSEKSKSVRSPSGRRKRRKPKKLATLRRYGVFRGSDDESVTYGALGEGGEGKVSPVGFGDGEGNEKDKCSFTYDDDTSRSVEEYPVMILAENGEEELGTGEQVTSTEVSEPRVAVKNETTTTHVVIDVPRISNVKSIMAKKEMGQPRVKYTVPIVSEKDTTDYHADISTSIFTKRQTYVGVMSTTSSNAYTLIKPFYGHNNPNERVPIVCQPRCSHVVNESHVTTHPYYVITEPSTVIQTETTCVSSPSERPQLLLKVSCTDSSTSAFTTCMSSASGERGERGESKPFPAAAQKQGDINAEPTSTNDVKLHKNATSFPTNDGGEQRPRCPECFQTFKKRAALERHMMIHRGIKPFQCHFCNQRFRQKHHLQGHIMLHTGERPHSCNLCNKRFRMRHHLLEHERISHKVFR